MTQVVCTEAWLVFVFLGYVCKSMNNPIFKGVWKKASDLGSAFCFLEEPAGSSSYTTAPRPKRIL